MGHARALCSGTRGLVSLSCSSAWRFSGPERLGAWVLSFQKPLQTFFFFLTET